ncbi:MAG: cytochrome c oxidase subunit II, partial [Chloroflexota bacterium]
MKGPNPLPGAGPLPCGPSPAFPTREGGTVRHRLGRIAGRRSPFPRREGGQGVRSAAVGLVLVACEHAPSALDPHGPQAAQLAWLGWFMFAVATAIFVLVMALLLYGLFRRRRTLAQPAAAGGGDTGARWVVIGGIAMPVVVLVVVLGLIIRAMPALSAPSTPANLTVEVIGYQYWWEVRYPQHGIVTANEIQIPVGQTVEFKLTSVDVIHSFWVPQLQGKMDLIPGTTNTVWL